MNQERRKTLVTGGVEIGKFTAGGVVIGYFMSQRPVSEWTVLLRAISALWCFALAGEVSRE